MLRVLFPGRDSSLGTYIILTIPENINLFFNFIHLCTLLPRFNYIIQKRESKPFFKTKRRHSSKINLIQKVLCFYINLHYLSGYIVLIPINQIFPVLWNSASSFWRCIFCFCVWGRNLRPQINCIFSITHSQSVSTSIDSILFWLSRFFCFAIFS